MCCLLRTLHRTCHEPKDMRWRKCRDCTEKVQEKFKGRTSRRQRAKSRVKDYLKLCSKLVARAALTREELRVLEVCTAKIDNYLVHVARRVKLIKLRVD